MFSDIRGFTALVESQPPEETIELLNTYYTLMFDAISGHGGVVNQMIGDGLMAIFGAPLPLDDHARRGGARRARHDRDDRALQRRARAAGKAADPHRHRHRDRRDGRRLHRHPAARDLHLHRRHREPRGAAGGHTKVAQRTILIDAATRAALASPVQVDALGPVPFGQGRRGRGVRGAPRIDGLTWPRGRWRTPGRSAVARRRRGWPTISSARPSTPATHSPAAPRPCPNPDSPSSLRWPRRDRPTPPVSSRWRGAPVGQGRGLGRRPRALLLQAYAALDVPGASPSSDGPRRIASAPTRTRSARVGRLSPADPMPRPPPGPARRVRAAPPGADPAPQPCAGRHGRWCGCASTCSRRLRARARLAAVDADLRHLFSSWFNRGFLVLRRSTGDARAHPREDHPLRGGARDRRLGRSCAAGSSRPTGAASPSSIRRSSTSR